MRRKLSCVHWIYIKLGCIIYLGENKPQLSMEKIKAGIQYDDPQIGWLFKDPAFVDSMNEAERKSCTSFVAVLDNFLG